MVHLSNTGEVGQFVSTTQFDGGSTGKCGFYSAATVAGSAAPGAPTWLSSIIASSAHQLYAQFDGSDTIDNQAGMTQAMLHDVLHAYHITGEDIAPDWTHIKQSLASGKPVIICAPETQMIDVGVGGSPYPWNSDGINHIILLTGIASDGNVLVRDSANITPPNTIRPGPRVYAISELSPFWATAVTPRWFVQPHTQEEPSVIISLNNVAQFFTDAGNNSWHCKTTNYRIGGAILTFYRAFGNAGLCGLTYLGLPLSNEIQVSKEHPEITLQSFERGIVAYDPHHILDSVPGAGDVYLMHINSGAGQQIITQPIQSKLTATQNAYNSVVTEKNSIQAQISAQNTQLTDLKSKLATAQQELQQSQNSVALEQQINDFKTRLTQIATLSKIA